LCTGEQNTEPLEMNCQDEPPTSKKPSFHLQKCLFEMSKALPMQKII